MEASSIVASENQHRSALFLDEVLNFTALVNGSVKNPDMDFPLNVELLQLEFGLAGKAASKIERGTEAQSYTKLWQLRKALKASIVAHHGGKGLEGIFVDEESGADRVDAPEDEGCDDSGTCEDRILKQMQDDPKFLVNLTKFCQMDNDLESPSEKVIQKTHSGCSKIALIANASFKEKLLPQLANTTDELQRAKALIHFVGALLWENLDPRIPAFARRIYLTFYGPEPADRPSPTDPILRQVIATCSEKTVVKLVQLRAQWTVVLLDDMLDTLSHDDGGLDLKRMSTVVRMALDFVRNCISDTAVQDSQCETQLNWEACWHKIIDRMSSLDVESCRLKTEEDWNRHANKLTLTFAAQNMTQLQARAMKCDHKTISDEEVKKLRKDQIIRLLVDAACRQAKETEASTWSNTVATVLNAAEEGGNDDEEIDTEIGDTIEYMMQGPGATMPLLSGRELEMLERDHIAFEIENRINGMISSGAIETFKDMNANEILYKANQKQKGIRSAKRLFFQLKANCDLQLALCGRVQALPPTATMPPLSYACGLIPIRGVEYKLLMTPLRTMSSVVCVFTRVGWQVGVFKESSSSKARPTMKTLEMQTEVSVQSSDGEKTVILTTKALSLDVSPTDTDTIELTRVRFPQERESGKKRKSDEIGGPHDIATSTNRDPTDPVEAAEQHDLNDEATRNLKVLAKRVLG